MPRLLMSLAFLCAASCLGDRPERTSAIPPAPSRWVTDRAGLISEPVRARLDRELEAFERRTGHQVVVWIGASTGGVPLEEWAARTFAAWGVGSEALDDGLVLFILAGDRRARIEVGYGLEPVVPDALAGRILDEALIPGLAAGRANEAVADTVHRLLGAIGGDEAAAPPPPVAAEPAREPQRRERSPAELVVYGVLLLGMMLLFWKNPALAILLLSSFTGRGHGGGFGGGGFGGGGGSSGGGGASRSW